MSKVLVVNECHLEKTPDGNYWSNGIIDYSVFKRYLVAFDEVIVAIRVKNVKSKSNGFVYLCNGEGVKIATLPDFYGAIGYIKNILLVKKIVKRCCRVADCAIIRTPSAVSFSFLRFIDGRIPYALEVSGDPWNHMAPGEYKSRFRPLIRRIWTNGLKKYCMKANGVSYVTERVLQERYPCRAIVSGESIQYFSSHYSTVSINENEEYTPKKYISKSKFKIIHVANAFTTYGKGHKEAMNVILRLNETGINTSIDFIGEGPLRTEFEKYAMDLKIADKVHFRGRLSNKKDLYMAMREADLFLFPTHSEGLPRVVIESMHVGTPCVATNVGGILELIDKEYITDVGDVNSLFSITKELLENPKKMTEISKDLIDKSKKYTEQELNKRRYAFYKKLQNLCDNFVLER